MTDDGWDGFVDEGDEELMTGWNKRHEEYEEFEVVEQLTTRQSRNEPWT